MKAESGEAPQQVEQWTHVIEPSVPWPARIGLRCRIVTEEMDPTVYPRHGLGKGEVIVLIEDDPLCRHEADQRWTCVLDRTDLAAGAALRGGGATNG
jgi:hypothetical protein